MKYKGYGYTSGPHAILRRVATLFAARAHNYKWHDFEAMLSMSDLFAADGDTARSVYQRRWRAKRRLQCELEKLRQSLLDCSLVLAEVTPPNMKASGGVSARRSGDKTPTSTASASPNYTNDG